MHLRHCIENGPLVVVENGNYGNLLLFYMHLIRGHSIGNGSVAMVINALKCVAIIKMKLINLTCCVTNTCTKLK